MKKSYILAVCAALACTALAGCGPAEENTNVENPVVTTSAETEETTAAETEAATTAAETSESSSVETTVAETTEVSESETEAETTAEEKKEEEKKEETTEADNSNAEQPSGGDTQNGGFSDSDLAFTLNGSSLTVGNDLSGFIGANAPSETSDPSPSCLGEGGEDIIYTFDHFTINGYRKDDLTIATDITFSDSDVATSKGIKIGSSKDDVIKAYGSGYTEQGRDIVYSSGKNSLRFTLNGDSVSVISFYHDLLG